MDNADLEKLRVSPGKLTPKFKAGTTKYSVTVASSVAELKLTVLTSDSGASYTIKGTSKDDKKIAKLNEGEKLVIEVTVSAEDGKTTKTYTIEARRLSADDATLSSLTTSVGTLSPSFSAFEYSYECYVGCSVDNVSLAAKSEDAAMKISLAGGKPMDKFPLSPGKTLAEINVLSVNGKSTTKYIIVFIKPRLPVTLKLKKKEEKFECAICCGVLDKPVKIKGGSYHYCQHCVEEVTRTNKMDPFTGKSLEEGWMEQTYTVDEELGKADAIYPSPSGSIEAIMNIIGTKIKEEREKSTKEEPTESCKECSKKIPTVDLQLHKELLCDAKKSLIPAKQEVKVQSWEKRLKDDSIGNKATDLIKKGLTWEEKYIKALPHPGESPHYGPDQAPIDHLQKAARCYTTAISSSPRESQSHLALGLALEDFFYLEDLFGMKREDVGGETEGEAELSSKEEEFLAICKLHGVSSSATLAIKLKAVEAEYLTLKDAGQTHKAEHVQSLYAWKSKKALQASQGSYAVDAESPLYKAKQKYRDAVSCNTSDAIACFHFGRLCLLLGEKDEAKTYLSAAVSAKPTLSPARFCLGLALASSHQSFAKNLLVHGLSQYLDQMQLQHEINADPSKKGVKELYSKSFYRQSNTLIIEGFLCLASLSGHGHLTKETCLLSSSTCVSAAHLHHRASTYEKLLWSSLKARAQLLQLLHANKDGSVLRHCKQLSALISNCGLKANPELREMQLEVFQLGVLLQPSSSEALCHLGNGQLMQYDATSDNSWLEDAELSFRSSIELEGKTLSSALIPDKLREQGWWKKKNTPSGPTQANTSGSSPAKKPSTGHAQTSTKPGPAQANTKPGPTQSHCNKGNGVSRPAAGAAAKKVPPSKTTGTGAGAGKKPGTAVGGTSRAPPPRGGAAVQKSGVGGGAVRGTSGKPAATDAKKQQPAQKTTPIAKQQPGTSTTAPKAPAPTSTEASKDFTPEKNQNTPQITNARTHLARLGLARALTKTEDKKKREEAEGLYEEVIKMAPELHDAYIELGDMLAKLAPAKAVEVYSKFPFSEPPTFDDAFLHGEIVRLVMKNEDYDNPRLCRSLIAMGKALGIGVIDKQVAILEGKFKSAVLKTVYAGIHGKPVDDPELQAFFKFKCWL